MKFKDYQYKRPDMAAFKTQFTALLQAFKQAPDAEAQNQLIAEINALRNDVETMFKLVQIRYSIDTTDAFYETENDFVDEQQPVYEDMVVDYYRALVASPHRAALAEKWGKQLFDFAACKLKTSSPEVLPLVQRENKLASEYRKLMSSAAIEFNGGTYNLQQMGPFMQVADRAQRRAATNSYMSFFEENEAQLDRIYDDMVKLRHAIALKLGFNNFIELGYARMGRTDYDAAMVEGYRQQVLKAVVPLATELKARQRQRIGVAELKHYDEPFDFVDGNATPKGSLSQLVDCAQEMYRELSPETAEFFDFMVAGELLDLAVKKGKSGGGYCEFINNYKAPFIFANFNGTLDDVGTLTHEAGHAFQVFSSRNYALPEYVWPTLEACEIHSMSMEFITWPWMERFFKQDIAKFKFSHLANAVTFIPYGVTVDEFQHFVYQNPTASPAERKAAWREIERKYLPHRDYDGNDLLERGGYWYRQSHIFYMPFYYIDYTLAQVCALQFWHKSLGEQRETAWQDYLRLCQAGGSRAFLGLVELANLENPFVDGTIAKVMQPVSAWLDNAKQDF
ncbi:MAG: oligoendopeptidase F [Clostridiales bacterium]|nr:MAG: oligoendopeptidase F [Clostridiales bacterium]